MGRLLCLDVGDRRIGLAVSDEMRLFASPFGLIERVGWGPDVKKVRAAFDETAADYLVLGLPKNMDGTEGFQAEKVRAFAQQLEKAGMRVEFCDERLSTVEAEHALIEGGMRRENRKTHVDKVAAAVILQRYLDTNSQKTARNAGAEDQMTDEFDTMDNEDMEGMDENQIIELMDEDGVTSRFEYLTTIDHEGKLYVALLLIDEEADEEAEDEDDGEVVILEIQKDENGEDIYATVEDEAISDAVFDKFLKLVAEMDEDEE
ncbi:MAG: Holliday junction resolvase RuvX [Clostridia bacterium]|nr:Holliday junction resolvase RuvX [Clostridia bacterium]